MLIPQERSMQNLNPQRIRATAVVSFAALFFSTVFETRAMIKHVSMIDPPVPLAQFDPWYQAVHAMECMNLFGPWMRRYVSWRARVPCPDAQARNYYPGRYTEIWYDSVEAFREANPFGRSYSSAPWPGGLSRSDHATARLLIPAMPTEDFLGKPAPTVSSKPFRWLFMLGYPEGVDAAKADEWYLRVHTQEAKNLPGLLRYVSYHAVPNSPLRSQYVRMSEMWFKDYDSYLQATSTRKFQYTKAPWVKGNEPWFVIASVFLDYDPDLVFIK